MAAERSFDLRLPASEVTAEGRGLCFAGEPASGVHDGMDVCGQRPSEPVYGEIGGIRECIDSLQKSNPRFSSVSVQYDVW